MVIKIAHFCNFAPNQCGMWATSRDNVLAERKAGLISEAVDWGYARERNQQFSRVGLTDEGVTTVAPDWAIREADILVVHSAIPDFVKKSGKPIILAVHGRPEYSFELERLKKGSCLSLYHSYDRDPQVKGFFTYWQEHLDYWIPFFKKPIDCVPAMVNLDIYSPNGEKYDFSKHGPGPHIIIADVWREDISPFNVLFAAVKFIKEKAPQGKIHIFGVSRPNETTAMANLFNPLKEKGYIGEVHGLVTYLNKVYRGADFLVTPHNIATRIVREALASGCPIVAGTGCKYTDYRADSYDVLNFSEGIDKLWIQFNIDKSAKRKLARSIAKQAFNLEQAGEAARKIYERIMTEPKPTIEIKKDKPQFCIHNFIAYCNPYEDKNIGKAYNRYMDLVPENDWACFIDHDAMFLHYDWYNQLYEIIQKNQEYDCFGVVTNRIGNPEQRFVGIDQNNHDIKYHRDIAKDAYDQFYTDVKDVTDTHCISGVVMLVKKSAWKKVGGFKEEGFLGIDNDFHIRLKNVGLKIGLAKGVYVYHTYRAFNDDSELQPITK